MYIKLVACASGKNVLLLTFNISYNNNKYETHFKLRFYYIEYRLINTIKLTKLLVFCKYEKSSNI